MSGPLAGARIHFQGVGGIGMSALAELAAARGAIVDGCDREEGENTARLRARGIPVSIGHDPAHAAACDLLVYTSAVPPDHPERAAAGSRGLRRGAFLARCLEGLRAAGISGTNGKTTTTWLTAWALIESGLDPTVLLGGVHPDLRGNLRIGQSPLAVAELDESDESFLEPRLAVAVITNVMSDHLSHYGSFEKVRAAFGRFAAGVSDTGLLAACADDPEAARLLAAHRGRKTGFGLCAGADLRGVPLEAKGGTQRFEVRRGADRFEVTLPLPGVHNLQNALAAIAVGLEFGASPESLARALGRVRGVDRRMQRLGEAGGVVVYGDYAHHPAKIRASLASARALHPGGRLLVVYQPHLFSRTRDYAGEFGAALALADETLLVDIYPAREAPLPGVTSGLLVDAVRAAGGRAAGPVPLAQTADAAAKQAKGCAALIVMGAGDIGKVDHDILDRLSRPD